MPSNGSYCCVINCSNNAPKGFRLFIFRYLNSLIFFSVILNSAQCEGEGESAERP